jgi:hypothetical protein
MEPFGALWAEVVEANPLKNMVGPWGLEPQTSTVSTRSSYKTYFLWVGLWVGKSRRTPEPPHVFPSTFLDSFLNSRHPGADRFGKQSAFVRTNTTDELITSGLPVNPLRIDARCGDPSYKRAYQALAVFPTYR